MGDSLARALALNSAKKIKDLAQGYHSLGSVDSYSELPTSGNNIGDSYTVQHADSTHRAGRYVWGKSKGQLVWYYLDGDNDYVSESELDAVLTTVQSKITETNKLDYSLLSNTPTIPSGDALVSGDDRTRWNNKSDFSGSYNDLTNKPTLFSGSYNDLTDKPNLFDGDYNSLTNKPTLFDGNYNNLTNKPTLFDGDYNNLTNKPTLFDGDYNSLTNKPTIITNIADMNDYASVMQEISNAIASATEIPTVTLTVDQVTSADPLRVQLTEEQYAIVTDEKTAIFKIDATELGFSVGYGQRSGEAAYTIYLWGYTSEGKIVEPTLCIFDSYDSSEFELTQFSIGGGGDLPENVATLDDLPGGEIDLTFTSNSISNGEITLTPVTKVNGHTPDSEGNVDTIVAKVYHGDFVYDPDQNAFICNLPDDVIIPCHEGGGFNIGDNIENVVKTMYQLQIQLGSSIYATMNALSGLSFTGYLTGAGYVFVEFRWNSEEERLAELIVTIHAIQNDYADITNIVAQTSESVPLAFTYYDLKAKVENLNE